MLPMFMFFIFIFFIFIFFMFMFPFAFAGLAVAVGVGGGDVAAAAFVLTFALFPLLAVAQPIPKSARSNNKFNAMVLRIEQSSSVSHTASENSAMIRLRICSADNPCFCRA